MLTVFKNATLIDGKADQPLENAVLAIENDRIVFSGPCGAWEERDNQKAIDLKGKWILPGLIDCHIHMDLHGFADTFCENLVEDKLRTLRAAKEMTDTLKAGFTTVRNVGSVNYIDFAVKQAIETGLVPGPRILTSGRIISMTCSGIEYFNGMYRLADGVDQCRLAAREQLKEGADLLKLMATGAVMNPGGVPGAAQLDVDEMKVVVDEGLKLGKHTAAHAHGARGVKNAVRAGVRTIEHGTMADDGAIHAIRTAGAYLVPTLSLHDLFEEHAREIPPFILEKSRQMQEAYIKIVKKAVAAGVKIAMGTDAGTNYNYHGNNAFEMVYLVRKEILTPMQTIRATTQVAAEAIQADEVGTLEKGKYADFLVLDENPLDEIEVLTRKDKINVYKGGALV